MSVSRVAYFVCLGAGIGQAGYVVVLDSVSSGAVARLTRPGAQRSNPRPGPSLLVLLARASRWTRLHLKTRIATVASLEEAATVAKSLGV